jgi:hypothetical protein
VAARVEHGDRADREEAPDIGKDRHPATRVAIRKGAADQQRRQQPGALDREDEADLSCAGDRERLPAERGQERGVADQRDGLAAEEQSKIAVAQRLERAHTIRGLRNPLHPMQPTLLLQADRCRCEQFSSTSTSRSRSRGPTWVPRATGASASGSA